MIQNPTQTLTARPLDTTKAITRSQTARSVFGLEKLRDFQLQVLDAIDSSQDCLAVSPTGSGKTLCFALPAASEMLLPPSARRLVLVVSPLIALMRDQATRLQSRGLECALFDRTQSQEDRTAQWQNIDSGKAALLFISPERLANANFRDRLAASRDVFLVAVDEAHCSSQWGFNFRPEYRNIGLFLQSFPAAIRMALTATASPGIRSDMITNLGLRNPQMFIADFARENIALNVIQPGTFKDQSKIVIELAVDSILEKSGATIIYAATRKSAETIHADISRKKIRAALYHGGLDSALRSREQDDFLSGKIPCMVATSAFGMGIDKHDIRTVIHAGLPQNLEQYLQETGRAGRDGRPAVATLVYHPRDYHTLRFMVEMQFPETVLARAVVETCIRECDQAAASGRDRDAMIAAFLRGHPKAKQRDVEFAIEYGCRESLFKSMTSSSSNRHDDAFGMNNTLFTGAVPADLDSFWRRYEFRRNESFFKLEKMRLYAQRAARSKSAGKRILDSYFKETLADNAKPRKKASGHAPSAKH